MKPRTIIFTTSAAIALAAPAAAGAEMLPVTHPTKHAKLTKTKKHPQTSPLYIYVPAPLVDNSATGDAQSDL
jgi:hypothetical protein